MKYYEYNGSLYTSNAIISNGGFAEITKDEYEERLSKIRVEQEPPNKEEWGVSVDEATEQDYRNALEEMGVVFNE